MNDLITFTPLDYFFFGGENTLGQDGENYFARSNPFPQQTTIVGTIRHLLYNQGLNYGNHSFNAKIPNQINDFGMLQSISPIFIHKNEGTKAIANAFLAAPFDGHKLNGCTPNCRFVPCKITHFSTLCDNLGCTQLNLNFIKTTHKSVKVFTGVSDDWEDGFKLENYNAKCYLKEDALIQKDGAKIPITDILQSEQHDGNAKPKQGQPRTDAFYKQLVYRFTDLAYSFACFVTWKDGIAPPQINGKIISLGAESRPFLVTISQSTENFEALFPRAHYVSHRNSPCIVLLSDTYLENVAAVYQLCHGVVTQTTTFRNIITPNKGIKNFAPLAQQPSERNLYKSNKLQLLKRGSVLYPKNNDAAIQIQQEIDKALNFKNIGYNYYHTI
jgi:CRISPR-associated protein Cmr3